jgi:CBS domain-containing protein
MGMWSTILGFGAGYALGANKDKQPVRRMRGRAMARVSERLPFDLPSGDRPSDRRQISEVMTPSPRTVTPDAPLASAARLMADEDIGDVLVAESGSDRLVGILTDRDIAIRAVAEHLDPDTTKVREIVTGELASAAPTDTVQDTLDLMKGLNVRRLPVVERGRAIGVISLGDLSVETDVGATLADISTAAPDR